MAHFALAKILNGIISFRELASSNLSFNEGAVSVLLRQAAWELGSRNSDSIRRVAHKVLEDESFVSRLIATLEHRLNSIRSNWKEQETLSTLVTLALRALSLSEDPEIIDDAISFLRDAREVAYLWCEKLSELLNSTEGSDNDSYQHRILLASAICQRTYDVEANHMDNLLSTALDTERLVRSSVIFYETSPSESDGTAATELRETLLHGRRILHRVEKRLRELIRNDPSGMNAAIGTSMEGVTLLGQWQFIAADSEIAYKTLGEDTQTSKRIIRYDLLTGELLINGHPPGRLPKRYTNTNLYRMMFNAGLLTVIPSDLPGAVYAATKKFGEYELHFGFHEGVLRITARSSDQLLQLVPRDRLERDFPRSLVDNYYHWLDPSTGVVEFRPIADKWNPSKDNWHLSLDLHSPENCAMRRGDITLVDINSKLYQQIAEILARLDSSEHVHVTKLANGYIEAELVRLKLRLFVNDEGLLECRELKAIVDLDQDIGCLHRLYRKLVLKSFDSKDAIRRSVVIPYGEVSILPSSHGAQVFVELPPAECKRVRYFRYWLNDHLRTLQGPHDMLATLYQCYLHAVTGYVLPDPFTGRLGTDEALRGLRQQRLFTSMALDTDCILILKKISELTPSRHLHPKNLRVMQTVTWNLHLSQILQHDDFHPAATAIKDHASKFSAFRKDTESAEQLGEHGDQLLMSRARVINSRWRVPDFGGSLAPPRDERPTGEPRDRDYQNDRAQRVYEIAVLIRDWPSKVHHLDIYDQAKGWTWASAKPFDGTCLGEYDLSISDSFGSLYDFCRNASRDDTFKLMSRFCMITYGGKINVGLLRSFLAIAFSGRFRDLPIPRYPGRESLYRPNSWRVAGQG
ncbi:predicted protein [Uncinocarpus reesii 1704]|uniref:Uncharacterized protein n=1 Tax=Uncinocarpus reesii (strain UAMH 1704) TaxID=336963 RepID=C4JQK6_UNCRE|nr:uncharacterized protein UREG_03351 [Uncinocarpus reesii 1704]EEP78505.1 predicted protein [Uncinocarpus reesii 1704]